MSDFTDQSNKNTDSESVYKCTYCTCKLLQNISVATTFVMFGVCWQLTLTVMLCNVLIYIPTQVTNKFIRVSKWKVVFTQVYISVPFQLCIFKLS